METTPRPARGGVVSSQTDPISTGTAMVAGITGDIVMDYKADRIMDYVVYALPVGATEFVRVLDVPMMSVSTNGTTCSSWLVRLTCRRSD